MDEENKQYNEKIKESAGKLSEAAKEKAKKEVVKKIITVLGAKGVTILILVVIGITWLTTVFLAAAIQWNDLVDKIKATEAKTKAIGEEPLDTILTIENGKYKIKYKNKDGKELTGKEAIKAILEDNDINFEDFSDEEIECLYKCLKAEWATTYPNLGEDVDNTDIDSEDIQGVITIKRGKTDGDVINLTYKPYEDFTNIKDESALNYFSIKDGNIIVANWSSSEIIYTPSESMPAEIKSQYVNTGEQINITETPINYKSMIGIHTIPFELLLSLLINTEEVEFASELADLAFDSTIEMTVYDNTTEIITIETEHTNEKTTYEKWVDYHIRTTNKEITAGGTVGHTSYSDGSTLKNEKINPVTEKKEVDYSLTTKTITKDNSYVVGLTNVSSWIGDIKNEYTYKSIIGSEEDLGLGTPNTYTEKGEIENISVNDSDVQAFKNSKYSIDSRVDSYNNSTHITERNCIIEAARKQGTLNGLYELTKNTSQTNEYKYESGTKQTTNIGKKFKEVYDKHPKAKAQLDCVSSWLFEMLEETETTVDYVSVMKYLLYVCTGMDYGISEEDILDLIEENNSIIYSSLGNLTAFGCNITKEEFIKSAKQYMQSNSTYQSKMAAYAETFYDVCTKNNVNPVIAYAHACLETGSGNNIPYNNYFGMAVYNGMSSGSRYSTPEKSINAYCKWVINNGTVGKSAYAQNLSKAQEWSKYNEKLEGTPESNVYVLYCRYAYLGDEHYCDEPDFNNPAGTNYYINHGSTWGKGGRVHIYQMYEKGALYTGKYKEMCGHKNANDPTTDKEKADYAVYTTKLRLDIAEKIFGKGIFSSDGNQDGSPSGEGKGVDIANFAKQFIGKNGSYMCGTEFKKAGWTYAGEWCAVFASYCYHKCGVQIIGDSIPETYVPTMAKMAQTKGTWRERQGYQPKTGDLIIYSWSGSKTSYSHVGIVVGSDKNYVYTVEGNVNRQADVSTSGWQNRVVGERKYPLNSYFIRGYCVLK